MVGFCNFISTPFVITPNYYLNKSALEALAAASKDPSQPLQSPQLIASRAFERYRREFK